MFHNDISSKRGQEIPKNPGKKKFVFGTDFLVKNAKNRPGFEPESKNFAFFRSQFGLKSWGRCQKAKKDYSEAVFHMDISSKSGQEIAENPAKKKLVFLVFTCFSRKWSKNSLSPM